MKSAATSQHPSAEHDTEAQVGNDPALVDAFVSIFSTSGAPALIADLKTRMEKIAIAGTAFPVTINDSADVPTNYICCPSAAYIDYAIDETRNFAAHPLLHRAARMLIRACAPLVRLSGLDHQVQLNNWLFSTNPVPLLDRNAARSIRGDLVARHPDRAIIIRSLNTVADGPTIKALQAEGFRMLASRQIYIFADRGSQPPLTKNMQRDRKRIATTHYRLIGNDDFADSDYERCEVLYNMLYLDKYTPLNPHYTALYIRQMHRRGIFRLAGFRDAAGSLVAVTALFRNGRTLTQPIVGYDTALPQSDGLYRMLMSFSQTYASDNGVFFNMSAGAADFKRMRGAIPAIEYSAVHVAHLSLRKRVATRIMETVLRRIGIPLLRRFEL